MSAWDEEKYLANLNALKAEYLIEGPRASRLMKLLAEQQTMLDMAVEEIRAEGITCKSGQGGNYQHPAIAVRQASIKTINELHRELAEIQGATEADNELDLNDE
jgi:phage terminase small subunit